jgi:hypothetical protein
MFSPTLLRGLGITPGARVPQVENYFVGEELTDSIVQYKLHFELRSGGQQNVERKRLLQ